MKNILVLDNNRYILEALSSNLNSYVKNCNILTAVNNATGEDILKSVPVDLILADIDMPVGKGYGFIENAQRSYPRIPVCVMCGECGPAVWERLRTLGVRQFIRKPLQYDVLANMISKELNM